MSRTDRAEISEEVAASIKNFSVRAKGDARFNTASELSDFVQKKAAMISAHFLLPAGARVVDMACGTGEITYALALLNPRWGIIGIDRNPEAVEFANKTWKLPNLTFQTADVSILEAEDDSIDGIVNSNILHHVYSESGYETDEVVRLLERQVRKLKVGGTMLIRDYMLPGENELVLLEFPRVQSRGNTPAEMSDADLLVHFSQSARPMEGGHHEGFFIEELMPMREDTRLFRLPHKWALEFIHRKDFRDKWDRELQTEYTFFNYKDYRREFARLGMRMMFSSPYSNPWVVKNNFKGRFQFYNETGAPMPLPATNYFIVAQKVADKQSLALEERRPSTKPVGDLQIMVVRDKKSGQLHELVKRPGEYCDILPYRITPDNRLVVYVRSGYPRPIVNAVMRGSHNLDGKRWSGHLIEPVTMDTKEMGQDVETNRKMIFDYVKDYAALRPKDKDSWYVGETYYPSPDRIDEAIEPIFIEVENPQMTSWPISADKEIGFTEIGTITELDGADILLAAQVGLLPEPRLEMHVTELMIRYGIQMPRWIGESLPDMPGVRMKVYEPEDVLKEAPAADFEPEKRAPVTLKPVKAVFVEEGKVGKTTRGLSAQDVEFIVTEDGIENIAIVLPISRDWDENLLVALEPKNMPVPNRMSGDGAMLTAPSFVLPRDVKSIDDAKRFIADKFRVTPDQVGQMGESYFTHTGVTPQRIYPFVVAANVKHPLGPNFRYMMVKRLWRLIWYASFRRADQDVLKGMINLQKNMDFNHDFTANRAVAFDVKTRGQFSLTTDKVAVEAKDSNYVTPARVMGRPQPERPAVTLKQAPAAAAPVKPPVAEKPEVSLDKRPAAAAPAAEAETTASRIGKRLMESYSQVNRILRAKVDVDVKETAPVAKVDKSIDAVASQLKKAKVPSLEPTPSVDAAKKRY